MSEKKFNVTDAEYEIMKILWEENEFLAVSEVCNALSNEKQWKIATVTTLINRLVERKAAGFEKRGKRHYYFPVLTQEEYILHQTKALVDKLFHGSPKNLIAFLVDHGILTRQEIDEFKMERE